MAGPFTIKPQSITPIQTVATSEGRSFRNTADEDQARIRAAEQKLQQVALQERGVDLSVQSAALSKEAANLQSRQSTISLVSSLANAARVGIDVAGGLATERLKGELQTLTEQLQNPTDTPSVEESVLGSDARNDPDFREAVNEMRRTKSAGSQGRLTRAFVIERYNEIVATAKTRNPLFSEELELAARDLLGFSPAREAIKQMLATSPEEEAFRALSVKAARLGITTESLQTLELSSLELQTSLDRIQLLKAKGSYDANMLGQQVRASTAAVYLNVSEVIAEQVAAGGVQDTVQMKAFIQQQFGARRAMILDGMPGTVDASLVNSHLTTLANEETRLLGMVDSGSLLSFVQNQNETLIAVAESDILRMPVIGKIYASLGKDSAAEVMGQIARFRTNPGALAAVFATGGEGAEALSLGLVLERAEGALDVVNNLRPARNPDEARIAAWFATKQMQTGNTVGADGQLVKVDGTDAVRLVEVIKGAGLDVSISAFNDPRVVRSIAATKETHGQLINLVDSYTSILSQEYAGLLSRNEVPTGDLQVVNGIIVDTTENVVSRALSGPAFGTQKQPSQVGSDAFGRWVIKSNRFLKLGETYQGVGVLPDSKWSGANNMLKTLTTGVTTTGDNVPIPKTVLKWGLDEAGNPIPITD